MNSDTENPFRPPEARLDEPDATHGEPLYRLSAIGLVPSSARPWPVPSSRR